MKIVLLIDIEELDPDDPQYDRPDEVTFRSMEFDVALGLRALGHQVRVLAFGPDVHETIRELTATRVDLVFNMTEEVRGDRSKDVNIAALLELFDLPYTGAAPLGMMLGRDKVLSKQIVEQHGLKVPGFESVPVGATKLRKSLSFPVLVKPQLGDGSEGIHLKSLVRRPEDVAAQVSYIHELTGQPAVCEEFIGGRELKVFIYGDKRLTALPAGELKFGGALDGGPDFATARVKTDPAYREKWRVTYEAANLSPKVEAYVAQVCKKIYALLAMRDYARLDMRLTPEGELYFIEANPNPALRPRGFGGVSEWSGIDYLYLLDRIVKTARARR